MNRAKKTAYPKGWDKERVRALANHYDNQPDDEAAREIENGFDSETDTVVIVPKRLVPAVKKLIAQNKKRAG